MNKRLITVVAMLIVAGGAAAFLLLDRQQPRPPRPEPVPLPPVAGQFVDIVLRDLSEEERQEIAGIFRRFYDRSSRGEVLPEDQVDVGQRLMSYLEADSIERQELNRFMARVSYYSLKMQPGYDASVQHPLIEEADSTR